MQQGNQESMASVQIYLWHKMKDMALQFSEQHAKTPRKSAYKKGPHSTGIQGE